MLPATKGTLIFELLDGEPYSVEILGRPDVFAALKAAYLDCPRARTSPAVGAGFPLR